MERGWENPWGDVTFGYYCLMGGCKENRARISLVVPRDRRRGMGTVWNTGNSLTLKQPFLTVGLAEHLNQFKLYRSREVLESPSVENFQIQTGCGSRCPCLGREEDLIFSRGPFHPEPLCDSKVEAKVVPLFLTPLGQTVPLRPSFHCFILVFFPLYSPLLALFAVPLHFFFVSRYPTGERAGNFHVVALNFNFLLLASSSFTLNLTL